MPSMSALLPVIFTIHDKTLEPTSSCDDPSKVTRLTRTLGICSRVRIMKQSLTENPDTNSNTRFNHFPFYAPRIWHGLDAKHWIGLLRSNRYQFDRWWNFAYISMFCGLNSTLNALQHRLRGPRVQATPMLADPVFILGHWRSGTTLLHNLLSLDERYAAPTTYQCFAPQHFMLSEQIIPRLVYLPRKRPMDNIKFAWDQPQECEFALCAMGLPSVYRNLAFPNHTPRHLDYLNMQGVPKTELERWKAGYRGFVQALNYWHQRPLLLKSPTNTGRIAVLLEMFPNAKFIHITRSPYDFMPSTVYLWEALCYGSSMQSDMSQFDAVEYAMNCYTRMYRGFQTQRPLVPDENFHEIRFEELIQSPLETLKLAYDHLKLGDFSPLNRRIAESMANKKNYRRNKHQMSARLRRDISEVCHDYMEMFGYLEDLAIAG